MEKKTKIVATIGPASETKEALRELISAGMNVARINFSHGTHESNGKVIDFVKELREEMNVPIGIMADLQGPRIRTVVKKETVIEEGEAVYIYDISNDIAKMALDGGQKIIGLDVPGIIRDIEEGNDILIEDGLMRVKIIEKKKEYLVAKVEAGGTVKNHKGTNIPDAKLHIPVVTEKDEKDLEFALKKEVDFVALSFVGSAKEIGETREKIKKILGRGENLPWIVSKIERKEAIKNIDEIISESDVVMVARGDLGIELPETKVVIYQKEIIAKCLERIRPVIVATQMLDSMIEKPIPTRAEVSDVSNAVIDHTDATMLSGESANGKYPVKALEMMNRIISDVEESKLDDFVPHLSHEKIFSDYGSVISSAYKLAKNSNAKAILAVSRSGFTARSISNFRPEKKILVATGSQKTYNQLSIVWGIEPYFFDKEKPEEYIELMVKKAKLEKKVKKGDKIVEIIGGTFGKEQMRLVGIKEIS